MPAPPIDRTPSMTREQKIGEAMRRGALLLPAATGDLLKPLLQPQMLAVVAATVVAWAVSQLFGIGEVVDAVLLIATAISLRKAAVKGGTELFKFAKTAVHAMPAGTMTWTSQRSTSPRPCRSWVSRQSRRCC